jgi:hypothetical protein
MTKYERTILDSLLDKYERSKSFVGDNKRGQTFTIKISKLYSKYYDEAEYELFKSINETVEELERKGFVVASKKKNGVIDSVKLNDQMIDDVYKYLSRTPKHEVNKKIKELLDRYAERNEILSKYCKAQTERLAQNKKAEYFDGDFLEYESLLEAVANILVVKEETYVRDFSIKVLGDSKAFEAIKNKVRRLLFQYGDFPEEETILEDLNIIKNPGHVYIKGNAVLKISGQTIDLSKLTGDIAVSSAILKNIDSIKVNGTRVMTIENLTTFNAYNNEDTFAVYLGGYHNSHRRNFIKKIYFDNPDVSYYHFGDIDAGGFYILLHLRKKTEIDFQPYRMGIKELQRFYEYTKPLTDNDTKRLNLLLDSEFADTVKYMMDNNCKLEQEAMDDDLKSKS